MVIKSLKDGKYKIESSGDQGKVDVFLQEGSVEIEGAPFVIDSAGEYEVKGIHIYGIDAGSGNKPIFLVSTQERIKVALIGPLKVLPSQDQLEELSDVDILLTSLGDKNIEALEQIEPNLFIPIDYSPELLQKYFSGVIPKIQDKLTLKDGEELTEEMEIVVLQ